MKYDNILGQVLISSSSPKRRLPSFVQDAPEIGINPHNPQ
jgi:hypothetical protein